MMSFVNNMMGFLFQEGHTPVIALLLLIIVALIYERLSMAKSLTSTTQKMIDAKIEESERICAILDRYHQGNLNLVEALNEIKIVLITLQGRHYHD